MNKPALKIISDGLFSLYIYYSTLIIGWQLVSFIYIYQSTNSTEILNRLENWSGIQPYLIGIGALITIFLFILHRISPIVQLQHIQGLPKQVMVQNVFLAFIFLNYLMIVLKIHLDIFELVSFIFAIWVLMRWGSVFYHSKMVAWRHPTTHGTFIIATLLNGCALLILLDLVGMDSSTIYFYLLILLLFDLFIVFARFQFLSKSGEATNRIARNLMGKHILYFGSRIIIGIFMPAIFILYMIFITGGEIKGVELLILVGTMLDRFLFISSVDMNI